MPSSQTNVVKIIESHTELGLYEGIGRWLHLSGDTIRLETVNSSICKINVISPSSNHWIPSYWCARDSFFCKWSFKRFPSISICDWLLAFLQEPIVNELIFSKNIGVSASGSFLRGSPKIVSTHRTFVSWVPESFQCFSRIKLLRICLELRFCKSLDFFSRQILLKIFLAFHFK